MTREGAEGLPDPENYRQRIILNNESLQIKNRDSMPNTSPCDIAKSFTSNSHRLALHSSSNFPNILSPLQLEPSFISLTKIGPHVSR